MDSWNHSRISRLNVQRQSTEPRATSGSSVSPDESNRRLDLTRQATEPTGSIDLPSPFNENIPKKKYSKYRKVEVLLLQWEADDLGVDLEIRELDTLLRCYYLFTTYMRKIPNADTEDYITQTIMDFRRGKGCEDLLIVYYGGHAGGKAGECTWIANTTPSSPHLNWLAVQNLLLEHTADVLLILDCCYATYAARGSSSGDNWFLGATAKESLATGVSWRSFTSAMIRELRRCAKLHKENGKPFTIQSIHGSLVLHDRDLSVTPVCTRLTDHECNATDLTPLRQPATPSRQSFPPAPLFFPPLPPSGSPLPQRPRPPLPPSTRPGRRPVGGVPFAHSTTSVSPENYLFNAVRLENLPASSSVDDVRHWLESRLGHETGISRIGPLTLSNRPSTVITFFSTSAAEKALSIRDHSFWTRERHEGATITLDTKFLGLSCLYSSTKSSDRNPTVDLVFVHGTDGHAINSFASHSQDLVREAFWPCTELPKDLEENGILPRIMTFGWDTSVWSEPHQDHQKWDIACASLRQQLKQERSDCPNRPIMFVGHGVGGLLVKQTIIDTISFSFGEGHFENPIKACFFFAVPHYPPHQTSGYSSVLAAMGFVLRQNNASSFATREALHSQNQIIGPLSDEFNSIRSQYSIHVQCFYEQRENRNMCVVPKECAMLDTNLENSHPVNASFQEMVRLDKSQENLRQVLDIMRDAICGKLYPKPAPRRNNGHKERVFPRLQKYDTVFLVDDSDSMEGPRWTTMSKVLAEIAKIAVKYDEDGVDVRFFNKYLEDKDRLNLNTSEKVMALFKRVVPDGPTPTADTLEEELGQYMRKLREGGNVKRLNVIVLTDGEPDEEAQGVEDVLVKYANQLKGFGAHPLQVGVQFVQIGDDKAATDFLRSLDDDLVEKRGIDRDVSFVVHLSDVAADICNRWWTRFYGTKTMKSGSTKRSFSVEYCDGWMTITAIIEDF